jgi:L-ascorbate metabolism protein UlaG (beta-lactamase superfamily)
MNSFWDLIKWKWSADTVKWPDSVPNKNYQLPKIESNHKAIATFINHATFLFQLNGLTILTDPVFSERVSPVRFAGPKRARAPGVALENLPSIDVVIISHNHYDHLDLESLKQIDGKFHPLFIVPLGDEKLLTSSGIQNVKEMDWWQEQRVKDVRIIFTPSQHWSSRTPSPQFKIYFAGDTGYSSHFLQIKGRYGAPDLATLPIGAYAPRWFMKDHHMNPEEAVLAHKEMGPTLSIGMHFGTFQLTDEGIDDPINELVKAREKLKVPAGQFITLDQGESQIFP